VALVTDFCAKFNETFLAAAAGWLVARSNK